MRDLVLAARLLRRSPLFTAAAVLTFALGIGVNTAVFSVINAALLRPLPVRDGDRLVVLATQSVDTTALRPVSYQDLQDYRSGSRAVVEDIAGYSAGFVGLSADGRPAERALVTWVTGNYFSMLDLRPALGRLIRDNEGGADRADSVVVLGYDAWQRRFGGDAGVLGSMVRIDGHPCTIVGVAPRGFLGTFAFSDAELYLPINWASARPLDDRRTRDLHAIARLQPGIDVAGAQAALDLVAGRLGRDNAADERVGVRVLPERLARPEEDQARFNARGAAMMLCLAALITLIAAVTSRTCCWRAAKSGAASSRFAPPWARGARVSCGRRSRKIFSWPRSAASLVCCWAHGVRGRLPPSGRPAIYPCDSTFTSTRRYSRMRQVSSSQLPRLRASCRPFAHPQWILRRHCGASALAGARRAVFLQGAC